jgi:aldehyde:ferredoxin oxidoreductase
MRDGPTRRTRLLHVDLATGRVEDRPVPERWRRRYLGGKGLGARYLYEHLSAGVDPLGPDNVLACCLGPVSGYLPGEPRVAVVTKSPLTGGFLDSYVGGEFAAALTGALDEHLALVVTGAADDPVRLALADGEVTVEPATTWGADAAETAAAHPDRAVACVGPAGEQRVAYATVAADGGDHQAGRGGAGAVMGSKRLKAVVVDGTPPDPGPLADLRERTRAAYRESPTGRWVETSGTVESVDFAAEVGVLPTRGWQAGHVEDASALGVEAVAEAASEQRETDRPGEFRVQTSEGETVPRGGTAMSLGAGLGIDAFDAAAELGARCDRLGLDLIDAGNAVAWAIRASEADLLDRSLEFGDPDGARRLLDEIAGRETPLGDALADGIEAAAERFGGADLVPTVRSMSLPPYDPRGAASMALAYATSDRGACHRRARPVEREAFSGPWTPERAAAAVVEEQDRRSVAWSLVADDFVGEALEDAGAAWLDAVGVDPEGDLQTVGERVWTLTRLFNVREGWGRASDSLPATLEEPLDSGPNAGAAVDRDRFERLLDAYYRRRGWSPDGRPTRETLARLGLLGVADDETPVPGETGG